MARNEDITYQNYEGIPGDYFRCEKLSAEFTADSCAKRWKPRQSKDYLGTACHRCPIGAVHADQLIIHSQYQKSECVRCHQSAVKLVRGLLCVSCYNRQLEVTKGRDRRGRPPNSYERAGVMDPLPKKLVRIHLFQVRYIPLGTRAIKTARYHGADRQEAMLAVLRQHEQPPVFVSCEPVQSGDDLFGGYHRFTRRRRS